MARDMVRPADDELRDPALFDLASGHAHPDVTGADPATGTGADLPAEPLKLTVPAPGPLPAPRVRTRYGTGSKLWNRRSRIGPCVS